jgi:hypothetical protein
VLGGAMTSLWVGCWRSQVPSAYSPECVEVQFYELRTCERPHGAGRIQVGWGTGKPDEGREPWGKAERST